MRAALVLGVIAIAGGACTRVNPAYCEPGGIGACDPGYRCDPDLNRCVADWIDGGHPEAGGDGGDVECTRSSDCTAADRPICVGTTCQACAEDDQCLARDPATPACISGQCLECDTYLHCSETAGRPLCGAGHTCQPCTRDAECQAGPQPDVGVCAAGGCPGVDAVLWVDVTGACLGDGGQATPFCKLEDAVAAAQTDSRKTIVVRTGTYHFIDVSDPGLDGLLVVGLPGAEVVIQGDATNPAVNVDFLGAVGLRRLHLTGVGITAGATPVLRCAAATCTAEELEISGGGGGVNANNASLTLRRSKVHDNLASGIVANMSSYVIENNFVSGNGSPTSSLGGVSFTGSYGTMRFVNNTVFANSSASGAAGLRCDRGDILTTNNILWENRGGGVIAEVNQSGGTPVCTITHTVIDDTEIAGYAGADNTAADPNFYDPFSPPYNLHLNEPSGALGRADPSEAPADDIDGEPRPAGGPTDSGADQR